LKRSDKTFHLVFTHDEEGAFAAIKQLVNQNFDNYFQTKPYGCIVMEPTGLKPVIAHKGGYLARITVHGHEAHSAKPDIGVNALKYAVDIYNYISSQFSYFCNDNCAIDDNFLPNKSTLNIGTFHSGNAANQIPGLAEITYTIRNLPGDSFVKFNQDIIYFCQNIQNKMREANKSCMVDFSEEIDFMAFQANMDSDFVKSFSDYKYGSFGTEAGFFSDAGIDTIVFGPGNIEHAHADNEFLDAKALDDFDKFIQSLT
jgi:acetylornithine deacetylase